MEERFFVALSRWAKRQDENFASQILVNIIQRLSKKDPDAPLIFLKYLTGFDYTDISTENLIVNFQKSIGEKGRPDICIFSQGIKAIIEVKLWSIKSGDQLIKYANFLNEKSNEKIKKLLLYLTNPFVPKESAPVPNIPVPFKHIYWKEAYNVIKDICSKDDIVTSWLVNEFYGFLLERRLILEKVNDLGNTGKEIINLHDMIKYAIVEKLGTPSRQTASISDQEKPFIGWYGKVKSKRVWIGFLLIKPHVLIIDGAAGETIPKINPPLNVKWKLAESMWSPLSYNINLDLNEVNFFDKDGDEQATIISKFIEEVKEEIEKA